MKSGLFQKAIPHIVAVVTFTILSFAYFYPVVLEGKKLYAHDTQVFVGSSKEIQDYREQTGKEALWTNSMFSGMPAFLISTKFPGNLVKHLDILLKSFKTPVAALFLAFLGFYILLLLYKVNPWLALTGALAYGFTTFLFASISAGHNTKVYAMAYMAPVIGSAIYAFRWDNLKGAALFALFLSLQIMANHIQITYYTFIVLMVFGIFELVSSVKEKTLLPFFRAFSMLFAGLVIAVGVNFASLYTTWEYSKESTRGKSDLAKVEKTNDGQGLDPAYITQWSYGVSETMTFLMPNFKGGASAPFKEDSETIKALRKNNMAQASNQLLRYWGTQPSTSGPVYFGAIILFLFIFGLLILPGKEKWWILTAVLLSILLSWGKNLMFFTSLFVDFFPGYNRFRAVTMILVIAGVCVPLLSVLALKEITEGRIPRQKALKSLKISAAITGGIALLFFFFPGIAGSFLGPEEVSIPDSYNWLKDAMIADRKMMLRADAIRAALLIVAGAVSVWLFISEKLKVLSLMAILSFLFLIDLIPVDARFLNGANYRNGKEIRNTLAPTIADKAILEDKSHFRVLNLTVSVFNDASTSYYHKSIGGYHGAKLKRYQELIESSLSGEITALVTRLQSATTISDAENALKHSNAMNFLNTKYIILSPDSPPLTNRYAMGNAWFVEKTTIVENADAELEMIRSIDPLKEAVADRRFADLVTIPESMPGTNDTIYLSAYQPNLLEYNSVTSKERIAVFSEIYYQYGWKAFIDDIPADHFRADYVLRAMAIPAGQHTITFRFDPESYETGNKVSLASSVVLIILLGLALVKRSLAQVKND